MNFASIRYGIRNIRFSDKLRVLKAPGNINTAAFARNYSQLLRKVSKYINQK